MYKLQIILAVSLICILLTGCAINPITGEDELMFYPEEKDIAIGQKYAPEVEKELGGKIANDELQDYINRVGQRIALFSHRPDLEYHFAALKDNGVNAIALPGGYVYVLKGMLEKIKTEAQLAALLGHEISHVIARDSSAALSRMQVMNLLFIAAITQENTRGAAGAVQVTSALLNLQYSRQDEQEADLTGLGYLVAAGYDPKGAIELIKMLEDENTVRRLEFFSTHPSPRNRKDYITRQIQERYQNLTNLKIGREDYQRGVLQHLKKNSPN